MIRRWETVDVSPTGWTKVLQYHFTRRGAQWSADLMNAISPGAKRGFRVIVRRRVS